MSRVIIIGASARAAAFSAWRAGLQPWCADLFADRDLEVRFPVVRLTGKYPDGFLEIVRDLAPDAPLLYTGGLENYPDLVDDLARIRELWGNAGTVLRRVRDPAWLVDAARRAGLPQARGERFLIKPLRSAGGQRIRFGRPGDQPRGGEYRQTFVEGDSISAVYLGSQDRVSFLGATYQLVGIDWLHADGFRYCGSIGPFVNQAAEEMLNSLGQAMAGAGLRGLFGVDGVVNREGFFPVEINPRYPASAEVLEQVSGVAFLAAHQRACTQGPNPGAIVAQCEERLAGKAILYAAHDVIVPFLSPPGGETDLADLPRPGDRIAAGSPVLTLFATGSDRDNILAALRHRAARIDAWLSQG